MSAVGSEESVEFLRRSLRDLDAELAAGDLSADDHRRLHDEYTARLARALRAGAEPPAASPPAPASASAASSARSRARRSRTALWLVAVVVLAVVSGVAVARTSGTRTAGQELSGGGGETIRQRLDGCVQLGSQRQYLEAVRCYTDVLADEPSSAEAHAYRGWTLIRVGDQRLWPQAGEDLDAAVALDAGYPDARVFRAVLRRNQGRLDEARADLAAFDGLAAPRLMRDLVDQLGLRQSLAPATTTPAPATTAAPAPATTGG